MLKKYESKNKIINITLTNFGLIRTASVLFPTSLSVSTSRILLTHNRVTDRQPNIIPAIIDSKEMDRVCRKYVPQTAIGPKKQKTKKSPHPLYPSGYGPAVYAYPEIIDRIPIIRIG